VAHIPDNLDLVQAAPILCAGVTTYRALKETEVSLPLPQTPPDDLRSKHALLSVWLFGSPLLSYHVSGLQF